MKYIALLALLLPTLSFATDYEIDPAHTTVGFKVRHLVSKTTGRFEKFKGSFTYDAKNAKAWKAETTIEATSINTEEPKRDKHLRSPDFFDVKKYPTITFKSTGVKDVDGNNATLMGDLTIHGVTKPVALKVEVGGEEKDPWGTQRAGFTATGKINRKDFGLTWNKAVEAGGFLVGDDVDLVLEVEGIAKPTKLSQK